MIYRLRVCIRCQVPTACRSWLLAGKGQVRTCRWERLWDYSRVNVRVPFSLTVDKSKECNSVVFMAWEKWVYSMLYADLVPWKSPFCRNHFRTPGVISAPPRRVWRAMDKAWGFELGLVGPHHALHLQALWPWEGHLVSESHSVYRERKMMTYLFSTWNDICKSCIL